MNEKGLKFESEIQDYNGTEFLNTGTKKMKKPKNPDYVYFHRRFLPHVQPQGATLFITYRLAFSLPKKIINELMFRKQQFENKISKYPEKLQKLNQYNFNKKQFNILDDFLGKYSESPQRLANREIALIVQESLFWGDEKEYELICFCIMPNHVHILIKPLEKRENEPYSLAGIMRKHKSFTANRSNLILERRGSHFWQFGYYDHYLRNDNEFYNVIWYILNNPVKTGLVYDYKDWEFSWLKEKYRDEIE